MPESTPWLQLLEDYHRRYPGATAESIGRAVDDRGRTSYQWLADDITAEHRAILDLACGDGTLLELLARRTDAALTGIDMSNAELEAARARLGERVTLVKGRAETLPFAAESFDAVVSHLALMLFHDAAAVLSEVARVLRPGGLFAAVVSDPRRIPGRPEQQVANEVLRAAFQQTMPEQTGDPRTLTEDGLREVFSPERGFDEPEFEERIFHVRGSPVDVATIYAMYYPIAAFGPHGLAARRDALAASLAAHAAPDGTVEYAAFFRHVRAKRSL